MKKYAALIVGVSLAALSVQAQALPRIGYAPGVTGGLFFVAQPSGDPVGTVYNLTTVGSGTFTPNFTGTMSWGCIGPGASITSTVQSGSGGGYGAITGFSTTAGTGVPYTITAGGSGNPTFFSSASLVAGGAGGIGSSGSPAAGGTGTGTTKFSGGASASGGGGGGGAGGPNGAGVAASGAAGGAGDNGSGGAGGASGAAGGAGAEWGAYGSGGGGGYQANGGAYGGGSGAGTHSGGQGMCHGVRTS